MSFSEWKTHKVGEFCDTISKTYKFKNEKVIFLNTGDIEKGKVLHNTYSLVDGLPGQAKKSIQKGDILLSEIRPANGRYAFVDFDADDFVVSTKLMVIRANEDISPRFLYHFLTNKETTNILQQLAESRSGTFPQITFSQVQDLEITLPDLKSQEKIASFVDNIDNSINTNQQINKTLEQMLGVLFKEICVSKNDELPEGWSKQPIRKFLDVKNGFAFKGGDFIDEGVPVIKIKNVKANKIILDNISYVSREVADKTQRYRIKQNDLLITMSGNRIDGTPETWVGKVGIFHRDGEYLLNQRVSILNILDEEIMSRYFLCQLLSTEEFQYYLISNATSSGGQANISPDLIYNTEIVVPPKERMQKYHHLAKDIYSRIFANELEIETLTNLRNTLLPKLMKGEIEING